MGYELHRYTAAAQHTVQSGRNHFKRLMMNTESCSRASVILGFLSVFSYEFVSVVVSWTWALSYACSWRRSGYLCKSNCYSTTILERAHPLPMTIFSFVDHVKSRSKRDHPREKKGTSCIRHNHQTSRHDSRDRRTEYGVEVLMSKKAVVTLRAWQASRVCD